MATLTEAMEKEKYSRLIHHPLTIMEAREAVKDWLKEVGLPDYYSIDRDSQEFNATSSLRRLLITLVDEPNPETTS